MEATQNLQITESAAKRIGKLMQSEQAGAKLRVAVEGGGCNGFQYKFDFDLNKNPDDIIIAGHGVEVLIDETSIELVKGSVLDYIETLGFAHFEIKNPQAASSCGCGNSFSV
jgi:iron-sulfur cluster insertion protein